MIKTMSNIEKKQRGLSVKYDERRVYELGFGNPDKNFRNYKFFTCDIRFGIAQPVLEEAAFQLLGYERFSITGMGDKTVMPNPWDDLFNTLKWAIDNKGLNPDYLRRVSKYDFSVPENKKGERPQHTSDDEWEHYVKQVNSNERRIFSSEELREIAAILPDTLKLDLFNDLVNISRIADVHAVVNHILVQNDGDDAVRFVNAVKEHVDSSFMNRDCLLVRKQPVALSVNFSLNIRFLLCQRQGVQNGIVCLNHQNSWINRSQTIR